MNLFDTIAQVRSTGSQIRTTFNLPALTVKSAAAGVTAAHGGTAVPSQIVTPTSIMPDGSVSETMTPANAAAMHADSGGVPWGLILGVAAAAGVVWFIFRKR